MQNRRNGGDSPEILNAFELLTENLVTLVMRGSGVKIISPKEKRPRRTFFQESFKKGNLIMK